MGGGGFLKKSENNASQRAGGPVKCRSFSICARLGSFRYAWRGLKILLREEHNARIHFLATLVVLAAGLFFGITNLEWCAVVFAIGLVWSAEALNTAIEYVADALCPERNELIGRAKDLAAAGVFLAALTAVAIGAVVFVPYLLN